MLTELNEAQRQAVVAIAEKIAPLPADAFDALLTTMRYQPLQEKDLLLTMGRQNNAEYFLLDGILRFYILSPDGHDVTLNFFVGPCALSPSIARSVDGASQVSCEALVQSKVVQLHNDDLIVSMMAQPEIQRWGDAVMRTELVRRMQREITLASKAAKQRLEQFRQEFAGLEDLVPHYMIASYLGITPVTLSRLRND